ncbi:hypothetical protein [Arthrobacter sp. NPDC056493]|uniref:hypothetical protein n=1 Tax=Arthrobacter sp. NPDC056493 TaxID=3345839 RepID=UPI0036734908
MPAGLAVAQFHLAVQAAFGWEDRHLYGIRYVDPSGKPRVLAGPDDETEDLEAAPVSGVVLSDLLDPIARRRGTHQGRLPEARDGGTRSGRTGLGRRGGGQGEPGGERTACPGTPGAPHQMAASSETEWPAGPGACRQAGPGPTQRFVGLGHQRHLLAARAAH